MTFIVIVAWLVMAVPLVILLLGYALAACLWLVAGLGHAAACLLGALARLAALLERPPPRR